MIVQISIGTLLGRIVNAAAGRDASLQESPSRQPAAAATLLDDT